MANMSYCRFQNTRGDLADCVNVLHEADEENEPLVLSPDEYHAHDQMLELCRQYLELVTRVNVTKK